MAGEDVVAEPARAPEPVLGESNETEHMAAASEPPAPAVPAEVPAIADVGPFAGRPGIAVVPTLAGDTPPAAASAYGIMAAVSPITTPGAPRAAASAAAPSVAPPIMPQRVSRAAPLVLAAVAAPPAPAAAAGPGTAASAPVPSAPVPSAPVPSAPAANSGLPASPVAPRPPASAGPAATPAVVPVAVPPPQAAPQSTSPPPRAAPQTLSSAPPPGSTPAPSVSPAPPAAPVPMATPAPSATPVPTAAPAPSAPSAGPAPGAASPVISAAPPVAADAGDARRPAVDSEAGSAVSLPTLPPLPAPPTPVVEAPDGAATSAPEVAGTPTAGPPLGTIEPSPGSARAPLWAQDMVRALRRVQDSMAAGSTDALEAQRGLIARIEQEFSAAAPATWQDPHNVRAAVTYFLSGGSPALLRRMMSLEPPPAIDPRLLRGTLAYLEGREDEALRNLKDIDARSLPPSLGGQIALAQAALYVRQDAAKSAKLLGLARLLAPGTLVEEAALRRAILIASQMGDADGFEYLTRQYLFRFRNSVYAGNFRQRLAAALSRLGFGGEPAQLERLERLLSLLEPESRRDMELTVARAAVVQGRTTAASFAADRALSGVETGTVEAERAKLYRGASLAPSAATYKDAISDLAAIDKGRLAPSDAALLEAAAATAETVRQATEPPPAARPARPEPAGPLTKDEMLPVMERARSAIVNADATLKGPFK